MLVWNLNNIDGSEVPNWFFAVTSTWIRKICVKCISDIKLQILHNCPFKYVLIHFYKSLHICMWLFECIKNVLFFENLYKQYIINRDVQKSVKFYILKEIEPKGLNLSFRKNVVLSIFIFSNLDLSLQRMKINYLFFSW